MTLSRRDVRRMLAALADQDVPMRLDARFDMESLALRLR